MMELFAIWIRCQRFQYATDGNAQIADTRLAIHTITTTRNTI